MKEVSVIVKVPGELLYQSLGLEIPQKNSNYAEIKTREVEGYSHLIHLSSHVTVVLTEITYLIPVSILWETSFKESYLLLVLNNQMGNILWRPSIEDSVYPHYTALEIPQSFMPEVGAPYRRLVVFIKKRWLEEHKILTNNKEVLQQLEKEKYYKILMRDKPILDLMYYLFETCKNLSHDPLEKQKSIGYLQGIIANSLLTFFELTKQRIKETDLDNNSTLDGLQKALDEMLKDFTLAKPNLQQLSRIAAMNRNKFQKAFQEKFGTTVYQYYQDTRFNEAKRLLDSEKLSVKTAANAIGYKSVSHFIKEFKNRFGLTPKQYIENF